MTEKGPKTLIKSQGLYSHRTIDHGSFTSLKSYRTSIFKQIRKIFNSMAINVKRISLTRERLHFLHYSGQEVLYELIDVLAIFQSFCSHQIFVKLNLPIFIVLVVGQSETSRKYFDPSAFN